MLDRQEFEERNAASIYAHVSESGLSSEGDFSYEEYVDELYDEYSIKRAQTE